MRTYLSAEYSLETSRHEGLDLLEGAVDAMDIRGDKLRFMDTHSQIFCPPARFDYQPHMGDEVSLVLVISSPWYFVLFGLLSTTDHFVASIHTFKSTQPFLPALRTDDLK